LFLKTKPESADGVIVMWSDAGVCYDESESCLQFAKDGKCINLALHKFANFCKKACGLCGALYTATSARGKNTD